jgi:predicted signal transduction protein with EAL and GGDEF domain
MGGDEFVIVLAGFRQPVNLPKILWKILKTLSRPFRIENHDICISASIGVAVFPEDGQTADTLLRNADTAMYVAKKEGGDSYQLFSREMNRTLMARLELESNLRRALEREELFLHFQPCFDLQSGHPMAVEALVRWSHPRRGILTPDTFLDTAEEMGLMPAMGEWVLRKACEDCRTWQKLAGRPIPVAVNLSARQFGQLNLAENIAAVLRETGLPPHSLILEIDEATLQQHADRAGNIIRNLRSIGVRWSVDRFGSGYFSLRNLHALPLDILKIDRHFIRNLATSPDNDVLIGTILSLARNLRLTPVAGGVETEQQLRRLLALGCHQGQGFLFQSPCHANEIKLLLHRPPRRSR